MTLAYRSRIPGSVRAGLLILPLMAGGCATLPNSGPTAREVVAEAAPAARMPASLIEVTAQTLPDDGTASAAPAPANLASNGEVGRVGPGDVLQITVFELGTTLFTVGSGAGAAASGQPAAAGNALPPITVTADGTIAMPYVGTISVAGETPEEIGKQIVRGLSGLSEHAQVSVAVRENMANAVFVLGTAKTPGRIPLSDAREHLLDAIALAGGATSVPQDTIVRVTRSGRSAEIGLDELLVGSPDDLTLLPGDRIELLSPVETFTVFGATDKVSEIPFEMRHLTLAQAVARAGGPSDRQADPTAVFLFRWANASQPGERRVPIIYRLNMMQPESYFLSQHFAMRNGDVIYIANARSNQASKLVQIINELFSPFYGIREVTR